MAAVELLSSRRVVKTDKGVTVLRYYTELTSGVSAGADGWSVTSLPDVGDESTWASATWSLYAHPPKVVSVDLDPRSTRKTAIFKVTAYAPRQWE